jgi:surfeit locus 1 family protein
MAGETKSKGLVALTIATLIGLAILMSLGFWQWQRKAWKEELIATIEARASAEPLPPEKWASLDCRPMHEVGVAASCEFTSIRLVGRFDHSGERHVFTNAPRDPGPGGPGYSVFTPFDLATGAARIYVNRGFVPEARKDPETRPEGQITGEVEIVGQIRTAEQRGTFTGDNNPGANVWFLRNPREFLGTGSSSEALSRWQGAGPSGLDFYLDQISPPPPGGLPAPRASRIQLSNRHLEYALTWWGLAATLICVYAALLVARLKGRELQDYDTHPGSLPPE